jgi:hypothetical protein
MFFVKRVSEAGRLLVQADMTFALSNVCFWRSSGHQPDAVKCLTLSRHSRKALAQLRGPQSDCIA